MPRPRSSVTLLPAVLASLLALPACDTQDPEPRAGVRTAADDDDADEADEDDDEADDVEGPHGDPHRGGAGHKLDRLCGELACTAEQRSKIEQIFAGAREGRPERTPARAQADADLAARFRGDTLTGDDLARYRAVAPPPPHDAAGPMGLLRVLPQLHAVLTPQQRDKLATHLEARHDRRRPEPPDAAEVTRRSEHHAARVCEKLTCTPAQLEGIAALLREAAPGAHTPPPAAVSLVDALRRSTLTDADVEAVMAGVRTHLESEATRHDGLIVRFHALLDARQRELVATRIERRGLGGLASALHGGKHGGRGGHPGRHHGDRYRGGR